MQCHLVQKKEGISCMIASCQPPGRELFNKSVNPVSDQPGKMVVTQSPTLNLENPATKPILSKEHRGLACIPDISRQLEGTYLIPPVIVNAWLSYFNRVLRPTDWSSHCKVQYM